MEYEFRLFYIEILTEDKFKLQLISKNKIATPVAETQFFRSPKSNSTYFLIVLTELEIDNTDSNLFILKFNCTRPNEWKYLKYTKLTGYRLEYNKFFSISCTYLNEYPILVAGLNDFGLIFVNLEDKDFRVIHQLSLKSIDAYILDKITIYKIFKISNNSLRVLIKEMGGFSLYWDKIYIERDKNIFDNLKMSNWINVFENEVASDLVTKTSIGYAQIIYFPINDSLNEACLRIYNLFNKNKSKVLYEVSIGRVATCNSITSSTEDNERTFEINVIWESTIFTISINLYPDIQLQSIEKSGHLQFELLASNQNSKRKIEVEVDGKSKFLK